MPAEKPKTTPALHGAPPAPPLPGMPAPPLTGMPAGNTPPPLPVMRYLQAMGREMM